MRILDSGFGAMRILRRIALVGLIAFVVLFSMKTSRSYVLSNVGLVFLMNAIEQDHPAIRPLNDSESLLRQALTSDTDNSSAHRGIGFVYWLQGQDLQAFTEWQTIGLTFDDYIRFGKRASSAAESLRWFYLAERLEPTNPELWLYVGQICQRDFGVDLICDRFLANNSFNWLVNSEFLFGRAGWHFNRLEGADYDITSCPDRSAQNCAMIQVDTVTSPYGTSWQQCLALEEGRTYRYSVWLKVQTDGEWIPLYYQGSVDGAPKGYSVKGTHTGSNEWTYWEHDLTAPAFDNDRACFYPVRLLDVGEVWFHSPALKLLQ